MASPESLSRRAKPGKRVQRKFAPRGRQIPTIAPAFKDGTVEWLYGLTPVAEAIRVGRRVLHGLHLKSSPGSGPLRDLLDHAQIKGVPLHPCSTPELTELCESASHQGAVLECGPLPFADEGETLNQPAQQGALLVALDQVEDPRNLGAIARCCAAFGGQGLVVPRRHSAPLSPAASKASAGTLESLPVVQAANLVRFMERAAQKGYWCVGSDDASGTPLHKFDWDRPLVLVLGSEGGGLRPLVRKHCDAILTIPSPGAVPLNVSAAAAILLYHLRGRTV